MPKLDLVLNWLKRDGYDVAAHDTGERETPVRLSFVGHEDHRLHRAMLNLNAVDLYIAIAKGLKADESG